MNDWFEAEVPIDAGTAAAIARAMRRVAQADGMIHHRELALIASFEAALPEAPADGRSPTTTRISDPQLQAVLLRSLIMVALADGKISDPEGERILELADEHGIDRARVEAETLAVKRRFLSVFAGVDVFRDAVVRVARDLGLSESEVDALQQEA